MSAEPEAVRTDPDHALVQALDRHGLKDWTDETSAGAVLMRLEAATRDVKHELEVRLARAQHREPRTPDFHPDDRSADGPTGDSRVDLPNLLMPREPFGASCDPVGRKLCANAERYRQGELKAEARMESIQGELNALIATVQTLGYRWEDKRRPL